MEGTRIEQAIQRIETALARIDAAAAQLAVHGEDAELAQRHQSLRSEVSATLQELDQLIEGMDA